MPEVNMIRRRSVVRDILAVTAAFVLVASPFGSFARGQIVDAGQPKTGETVTTGLARKSGDEKSSLDGAGGESSKKVLRVVPGKDVSGPSQSGRRRRAGDISLTTKERGAQALPSDGSSGDDDKVKGQGGLSKGNESSGGAGKAGSGAEKDGNKGYEPRGPTLVTGALGFTYGLTDDSVGGFELAFTYGYRLTDWIWFDSQANFSFGSDCKEILASGVPKGTRCGSVHGFGISLLAGVQWMFYNIWKVPVVPFVRADVGVVFVVTNGPYDGAAFVARGGGGARYHFTPWFSVGGEVAFVVGPVVRNDMPTNFFASVDVLAGAQFTF